MRASITFPPADLEQDEKAKISKAANCSRIYLFMDMIGGDRPSEAAFCRPFVAQAVFTSGIASYTVRKKRYCAFRRILGAFRF
jgi:hypothetical protein